jgi:pimeloyl-ACP methyl ester carboxylesterase
MLTRVSSRIRAWRVEVCVALVCVVASALGASYEWIQGRRDLAAAPPPGLMVDVGGHRLHLWCFGQGAPTVVFDSGLGGTAFDWYDVLRDVSRFTRACAYDRAGMGYSDAGPSPRTSRRIAGELAELVRRSETPLPVVLVGWSYGGLFVRVYASEHESQVAGLLLVDAAHEDQAAKLAAAGFSSDVPLRDRVAPAAAAFGLLRLTRRPSGPRPETMPEPVRRFVQATMYRPSGYQATYDEESQEAESFDEVRALRRPLAIPVVVLSAGLSPIPDVTTSLQRDLLRLSARSCQIVAAQSDHRIPMRAPDSVVRATRVVIDAWRTSSMPKC